MKTAKLKVTKQYVYLMYRVFSWENNEKKFIRFTTTGKGIKTVYNFSYCEENKASLFDQLTLMRMLPRITRYLENVFDFDTIQVTTKKNPYDLISP